jgi:TRAP-type C4-dicarboxylate transport system permease small subunit
MSPSVAAPEALAGAAVPGRKLAWFCALNALLSRWVLRVACLCLAGLGAVVVYGVVMRYAFNDPPYYIEQVALMLVICVAMFGAASGVHDVGHIGLDSVVKLLPPKVQLVCKVACELLVMAFAVLLLTGGTEMAWSTAHDTIPTLGISESVRYVPPIIAGFLILLFSIQHLLLLFVRKDSPSWN